MLSVTTALQDGSWDDPVTWSDGVPDDTLRAVIPQGQTVTLAGTAHEAMELVIQGRLEVEEVPGADKTLTANWIHVNSGGVFQIGTELDRYDEADFVITITGQGTGTSFDIEGVPSPVNDNNAFLMVVGGGRLQFFGEEKLSFTKLAETAASGSNQIRVESAIDRDHDGDLDADTVNWEVGDQVVIASSTPDYRDEEVRTITAIAGQGDGSVLVTLNSPLQQRHYGEIETYSRDAVPGDFNNDGAVDAADYSLWRDHLGDSNENALTGNGNGGGVTQSDRQVWATNFGATAGPDARSWDVDMRAEVAILSRNVRVQGLASQDTDNAFGDRARFNSGQSQGFGAHTMIMGTAGQITIDSVQFDRMGQTGRLGRYPIHWHMAGDRSGDILRGASITNSNNRGVTVHGTHNLLIEGVVMHDVHGHGFFMEDAVETGNQYLANIAYGIHKVGRSEAVGNFEPDLDDPFIIDTHDHVGQNQNRFLSSAAYWITNPDNTWVGNVSAGSEGTGFWFILPDRPIGAAVGDSQYFGVDASRTNLRQFDYNSSHSSPAGLNFDRGSDIEVPVGAGIKAFFDGDEYRPPQEPQVNHYTGYKHRVGMYHRGRIGNFNENVYADNFTSTFITFTQRITDSLYVGNSRGNADFSSPVTGHSIYDGASTLTGNHFAGFAASNAHTFRVHSAANRFTSHLLSDTSFEDDGSGSAVSIATQNGGANHNQAVGGAAPSAIYDVDGTLTGHVGGGPGSTVVSNHPFFYDSDDFRPLGWNAWITDDVYAQLLFQPNTNTVFRVTSPDGDFEDESNNGNSFNTHVKTDDGDYTVSFPNGLGSVSQGFRLKHLLSQGPNSGTTVIRFAGVGNYLVPQGMSQVSSVTTLRNSSGNVYAVDGTDLYVKFRSSTNNVRFERVTISTNPTELWEDNAPASGISAVNNLIDINTVDGQAATGDASRGSIGQVILSGDGRFGNISSGTVLVDSQFQGTGYELRIDYFVPPGTTLDSLPGGSSPDTFYVQANFNGVNTSSVGFVDAAAAGSGWQSITLTGTVPDNTTNAQGFFIVADGGFGGAAPNGTGTGTAFYIDSIRFTVGLSSSSSLVGGAALASAVASSPAVAGSARPTAFRPVTISAADADWLGRRAADLALLARAGAFASWRDDDPQTAGQLPERPTADSEGREAHSLAETGLAEWKLDAFPV